jgi:hypothetical protein
MKKVYNVGINDADYAIDKRETVGYINGKRKQKLVWSCPYYQAWKNMLARCYSDLLHQKCPTYNHVVCCEEWHLFSNFKRWMEQQDWKGKQLDKDLLVKGNNLYSPETCIFVSRVVNTFMTDSGTIRGEYLIGVNLHKRNGKFQSRCNNPFSGKKEHLGLFYTEEEAHDAWRRRKHELACQLAELQTDERVANALRVRYK